MVLFCEGKAFPGRIEDKGWEIQSDDEETVVLFLLRDLWEKCSLVKSEEYQTWDPAEENSIGKKMFQQCQCFRNTCFRWFFSNSSWLAFSIFYVPYKDFKPSLKVPISQGQGSTVPKLCWCYCAEIQISLMMHLFEKAESVLREIVFSEV